MSSYYLATSENIANGANFYVEAAEGGYYLYFLGEGSAKTYLNVIVNGTHINAVYGDAPVSVYTWDDKLKTLKTNLDGTDYIIGTSATGTYTTLQPAKTTDNFYAQFVAAPEGAEDAPVGPQEVTLADAAKLDDGTKVIIKGVVVEIKEAWTDQYKNNSVYITDGTNTFYVFRTNVKLDLNDEVVIVGEIGSYNGAKQIAKGAMAVVTTEAPTTDEGGEEGGEETTAGEKFAIAASKGTLAADSETISWASENFTILVEKDNSITAIRVTDEDHFRLYQDSKMTITAAEGKKIAKVIITCTGNKNLAAESIVTEGVTFAIEGTVATLTAGAGVDAIVIDAVAQTRISSIEVIFA
jgi:hypothetical protein